MCFVTITITFRSALNGALTDGFRWVFYRLDADQESVYMTANYWTLFSKLDGLQATVFSVLEVIVLFCLHTHTERERDP